jgi:CheY-like chemotaxis protein
MRFSMHAEVAQSKSPEKALTILAVDDMEAIIEVLQDGLGIFGHTVLTALSGEEALRVFRDKPTDIVICDLGMLGIDGWKVASTIKSICLERGIAKTPFILLTGWDEEEPGEEKLSESGVDAVVQKPVDMTTLMQIVQVVLRQD